MKTLNLSRTSDDAVPHQPQGGTFGAATGHTRKIAVVGLGYVGLPVAVALGETGANVIGFDINPSRVQELSEGIDRTREMEPERLATETLSYTCDTAVLRQADFFIVTVPTPIDDAKRPDMRRSRVPR